MLARWLVLMAGLCPGTAPAAELGGRVELVSEGRPLRPETAAEAIVYFRPAQPAAAPATREPAVMSTLRKQFVPRALAITAGSQVRFPNQDPILHNAFSSSRDNAFDVGLYSQGDGAVVTFDSPGYVRVYCNVHHAMVGHILVLDTPHYTRPDAQGRFRLADLPAGEGELVLWHDRASPWRRTLAPDTVAEPLSIRLELSRRKVPPHMNKFGRPYGRERDGRY